VRWKSCYPYHEAVLCLSSVRHLSLFVTNMSSACVYMEFEARPPCALREHTACVILEVDIIATTAYVVVSANIATLSFYVTSKCTHYIAY
jgi:hypothetical protein